MCLNCFGLGAWWVLELNRHFPCRCLFLIAAAGTETIPWTWQNWLYKIFAFISFKTIQVQISGHVWRCLSKVRFRVTGSDMSIGGSVSHQIGLGINRASFHGKSMFGYFIEPIVRFRAAQLWCVSDHKDSIDKYSTVLQELKQRSSFSVICRTKSHAWNRRKIPF